MGDEYDRLDSLEAGGRSRARRLDTLEAHERDRPSFLRENWYRDVWLFVISVFLIVAVIVGDSENKERVDDVQQSRYLFQLANCEASNARNMKAKAKAGRLPLSPQGTKTVVALVDELQPFTKDCKTKAREGTRIPQD
jgi:hypothetical protein